MDLRFHHSISETQTLSAVWSFDQDCDGQFIFSSRISVFITTVPKDGPHVWREGNIVIPERSVHGPGSLFLSQQFQNTDLRCVGWPALTLGGALRIYLKRLLQPSFCQKHMSTFKKRNIYAANSNVRKLNFLIHHM